MASWLVAWCFLAAGPEAKLTLLEGAYSTGTVAEVSADAVVLETPSGKTSFPAAKILAIDFANIKAEAPPAGSIRIELIDGSRLIATSYTAEEGAAKIVHPLAGALDTRTRAIRTVRIKDPDAGPLDKSWQEILATPAAGDVLVVRKTKGMMSVLDFLDGTFGNVKAESLQFTFGGMAVDVKRERVEAMIYFQPADRQLVDPVARVEDASGSSWNAKSLSVAGGKLSLVTTAGVKAELPLAKIVKIDFSSGKVLSLVDLAPEVEQWTPFLAGPKPIELVAKLFRPRKGIGFDGQPLRLRMPEKDVKDFSDGLAIHSRTELVYRLPAAYRRFTAVAGIEERLGQGGHVRLEISGDGKVLYEGQLAGGEAAVPLELDLTGVRRLRILVDFGENLDIKDQLNLVTPRMWK